MAVGGVPFSGYQTDCRTDCMAHSDKSGDSVRMTVSLANTRADRIRCRACPAIGFSVYLYSENVMEDMLDDDVAGKALMPWSFRLRPSLPLWLLLWSSSEWQHFLRCQTLSPYFNRTVFHLMFFFHIQYFANICYLRGAHYCWLNTSRIVCFDATLVPLTIDTGSDCALCRLLRCTFIANTIAFLASFACVCGF